MTVPNYVQVGALMIATVLALVCVMLGLIGVAYWWAGLLTF